MKDKRTFEEIKKEFYDFKKEADIHHEGLRDPIYDYVNSLEEREKRMIDAIKNYCENEILKSFHGYSIKTIRNIVQEPIADLFNVLEEITQKPIDEVIRDNESGKSN